MHMFLVLVGTSNGVICDNSNSTASTNSEHLQVPVGGLGAKHTYFSQQLY